ncbi:MAG TPA: L,D-transpeptidase [Gammaproteobacteria bacterium]|nr:L,D-transpeptidase [Gammaproteobacteria bacterium]
MYLMNPIKLLKIYAPSPQDRIILVNVDRQQLSLYEQDICLQKWPVSTSSRGTGCLKDSLMTPTGVHRIAEKIGRHAKIMSLFKARVDTGQKAVIFNGDTESGEDQITSRILWLKGLEAGLNLGGDVDTYARYIYIHGTPEEGLIGKPASQGCIRMRNDDVIKLFELVDCNTLVYIGT